MKTQSVFCEFKHAICRDRMDKLNSINSNKEKYFLMFFRILIIPSDSLLQLSEIYLSAESFPCSPPRMKPQAGIIQPRTNSVYYLNIKITQTSFSISVFCR